jgi:hypothetical protein
MVRGHVADFAATPATARAVPKARVQVVNLRAFRR